MGYKILGYVVWNGSKWYLRKKLSGGGGNKRAAAMLGVAGLTAVGLVAAGAAKRSAS
jgi:hypothetical protein